VASVDAGERAGLLGGAAALAQPAFDPAHVADAPVADSSLATLHGLLANEVRHRNALAPLSIFRINGLGFSNLTQLIAFAGFLAVFFFLTLYMQSVLGYSAIQTGAAYLPLCFAIGIAAGSPRSCCPGSARGR